MMEQTTKIKAIISQMGIFSNIYDFSAFYSAHLKEPNEFYFVVLKTTGQKCWFEVTTRSVICNLPASRISFENVLSQVPSDVKMELLYYLDVFV